MPAADGGVVIRILHILNTADPRSGGPIEGALRAGEVWARQGHEQQLMTLDPPSAPFLAAVPATVHALGRPRSRTPWSRYGVAPGVVAWLRRRAPEYDAVIVAGLWNYATMAARLALVGGRTPYFVFVHGMLDPWFRRTYPVKTAAKQVFWLFNEGPLLRRARAVLFTTEQERIVSERAFLPYRVTPRVVGYGTADAPPDRDGQARAFAERMPSLGDRRFLLFLSRIHRKKGCDLLIEGFAAIAATDPALQLVIAGPDEGGLVAGLRAQAVASGIGDRVHFPGMLDGAAKWGAFRACDAFVLTSHQENFGVVVAEAMACGRPVLISDKVQICHEVEAEGAGLVEPDNVDGARALLRRYAALDGPARSRMGEAARSAFLARFTIEAAASRLMAALS